MSTRYHHASSLDQIPSIKRISELLTYDSNTGDLTWLVSRRGPVKAGDKVKTLNGGGYFVVGIDGYKFRAHRVAWALYKGTWPTHEIDHINGVRIDNRIANLRELEHGQNSQNLHGPKKNNTSGYLGVSSRDGKWVAQITINKQHKRIGLFDTAELAYFAYLSEKRRFHEANTL